jgi:LPS-assembly protein
MRGLLLKKNSHITRQCPPIWLICLFIFVFLAPAHGQEIDAPPQASPGFTPRSRDASGKEGLKFLRDSKAAAAVSADELLEDRERKRVIGRGFVDLRYLSKRVQADHIEVQTETRDAVATGNIIFQTENDRIIGSRIDFNLDSEKMVIYDAQGYIGGAYYITGNVIRRIAENHYEVIDGTFTTCEGDNPDWAFVTKKATFQVEGYAHLQAPLITLSGIPAAALPYAILPIKNKRTTGFLMPGLGYGNKNGMQVSPRFFWAINRWSDATFGIDRYTRRGTRLLGEYRYNLSNNTTGQIQGNIFKDGREETTLWDINALHISQFPRNNSEFKAVIEQASRRKLDRSLEEGLDDRIRQDTDTRLTYTQDLNNIPGQLSLAMRRREGIRENNGQLFQRFPELSLNINNAEIGTSIFRYNLRSSAVSFYRVEDNKTTILQRVDATPSISMPIQTVPWLGVTPNFGLRYTYWTDQKRDGDVSNNPGRNEQDTSPLAREMWFSSLNVVGPRYSKLYNGEIGPFRDFKHIFSFETQYSYTPAMDSDDRELIIPIDGVDSFGDQNTIQYGIVNRILTKFKKEGGYETRQLLTTRLQQTADIAEARREQNLSTEPRRTFGNVTLNIQSNPIPLIRFTHNTSYNVYEGEVDDHSTGILLQGGRNWYLGLDRAWGRKRNGTSAPREGRSDINFSAGYGITRQWFAEYLTRINKIENTTLEQSLILRYRGCCWGFNLTLTDTQDTSEIFFTFIIQGLLEGEEALTFERSRRVSKKGRFFGRGALTPYNFNEP